MGNLFKDKKGSLADPIYNGAYILVVAVTIFISVFIWYEFQGTMTTVIAGSSSEAVLLDTMASLRAAYNSFDYVFPILVGGLMLMSLIFAFKTGANIAWGFLSLIVWAIALLMSSVYVNMFASIASGLPTMYTAFPIISSIIERMNWVVFGWVALITLVMFRKNNAEDDATSAQRRFITGQ